MFRYAFGYFFLFAFPASHGQTFVAHFGSPGTEEGGSAVAVSLDGDIFVGGFKGDSAMIMRVDPVGNLVWSRTFHSANPEREIVNQLTITADGYLIGTGHSFGGSPALYRSILYFKFSLDGTPEWIRASTGTTPVFSYALLPRTTTEYVLVDEIYDTGSPTFADPMVHGVDASNGDVIWASQRLDYVPANPYIDDMYAATPGANGTYYTTGRIYLEGSTPGSMRSFISKFSGNGLHQWSRYHLVPGSEDARIYGCDIIYSADSLLVCYSGDIQQYSSSFRIGLIRTDTSGVTAWAKDYDLTDFGSELAVKVVQMPYGYAITGQSLGTDPDLFAVAVSPQGHVLWAKRFGGTSTEDKLLHAYLKNSCASGSDLIFAAEQVENGETDLVLFRIDVNGSVSCGESSDIIVLETEASVFSDALNPQPVPGDIGFTAVQAATLSPINSGCPTTLGFLGSDTTACSALLLDASSSGASSFLWQDGSTDATFTATGPGTYWVLASTDCCVSVDTVVVSGGSLPTASFTAQSDPCLSDVAFDNTSAGADQFFWQFGDGGTSEAVEPVNTYDSTGTFTVLLIASNACGADTALQDIMISALASITVSGPDTLCADEEGVFIVVLEGAAIVSSLWSTGEIDTDSVVFSTPEDDLLTVDVLADNGCSYTGSIAVEPAPAPAAVFTWATADCGQTVQFTDASVGASAWAWQFGNGLTSQEASPSTNYDTPGTFEVQLMVSNACGSDSLVEELSFDPIGTVTIDGPPALCPDSVAPFSVVLEGTDIASVEWSNGASTQTTLFGTSTATELIVAVTGTDGCLYADTTSISLLPTPFAAFSTIQLPCDSVVQFIDASSNVDSWNWQFGNGESSDGTDPLITYSSPGTYVVQLSVSGACGGDTASLPIGIGAQGTLLLQGPAVICDAEEASYSLLLQGSGLSEVSWSTGDTTSSIQISFTDDQVLNAYVTGSDGCMYTASLSVQVIGLDGGSTTYVPNVFTPNGDGLNETFAPVMSDPDALVELLIFNRWGQEIHATSSILRPWNGKFKDEPVPDGTYIYIVRWKDRCSGVRHEEHGHVTLLR